MKHKAHGFTIVELLIVIVIIAILAAITLVAYNGITNRSKVAELKADYRQIETALGLYRAEHDGMPFCSAGAGAGCNFSEISSQLNTSGLPTKTSGGDSILYVANSSNSTGDHWGVRFRLPDGTFCKQGAGMNANWWTVDGSAIPSCW